MKLLFFAFLFTSSVSFAQIGGYRDFELVESIPAGTNLDNPDIRNTQEVWLEMISGASHSIDLEEFYVSPRPGEPLDTVIGAIIAAAGRGVNVRLLVDARMYKTYPATVDSLGRTRNVTARVIDFGKVSGGVQHAKMMIIDSNETFIGSQNFDWRALKHIHELGFRIRHPGTARIYGEVFDIDWQFAAPDGQGPASRHVVPHPLPSSTTLSEPNGEQIVFTTTMSPKIAIPDSTLWDEPQIVRLIDHAEHELDLQFLTYSTTGRDKSDYKPLDDAIRRAAGRGVQVRMIVSDWSKEHPSIEQLESLSEVPNIQVRFSVIPEWQGGYVPFARVEHCKYIVADGAALWLGTSNAEKGYFYNLRNVGVVASNARLGKLLQRVFMKGWNGPYMEEITAGKDYTPRRHGEQ